MLASATWRHRRLAITFLRPITFAMVMTLTLTLNCVLALAAPDGEKYVRSSDSRSGIARDPSTRG